jgi:hypothetical protein
MLKKIIIMGDSWGIGAYRYTEYRTIESIPDTGLGFFLQRAGFDVKNISISADSNIHQLDQLKLTLNTESADVIIWFYTEVTRDIIIKQYPGNNFKILVDHAHNFNFDYAQTIYNFTGIPTILIGCLSPVPDVSHYTFTKTVIKSWLDELIDSKYQLPLNLHCNNLKQILDSRIFTDLKFVNDEIDKMLFLETRLENHNSFSDGIHPSKDSYARLAERITCLL